MADEATITRRFALKAFPFIGAAAAVAVGSLSDLWPAVAEQPASTRLSLLIEAHRRAGSVFEAARIAFAQRYEAVAIDLPKIRVQVGRNAQSGEPKYCYSENAIKQDFGAPVAGFARFRQQKIDELARLTVEHRAEYKRLGLLDLQKARDAANDAEVDAFEALIKYEPQTLAEMKAKALYLIEVTSGDEYDRIGSWHPELLASFAGIASTNPAT